jgi:hypothetical protein
MAKVTCDFNYGESVIVVLRTTVQATVELADGSVEVVTDHGAYHSEDASLIGVFPDPNE